MAHNSMDFVEQLDPNNLIKDGLQAVGVPAALIAVLALWWFTKAWIDQVKSMTATGQKVGRALRSAFLHVRRYRPRTLLGKLPVTGAVVGLQAFTALLGYLLAALVTFFNDVGGRLTRLDQADPGLHDEVHEILGPILLPNWITGSYLIVMAAMLFLAYRSEPRGWRLWLAAGAYAGPATLVTVPLLLCSPCLIPYALFTADQSIDMYELTGESPEAARALWWDQNGWVVVVIGICALIVLLAYLALRAAATLKDTWTTPPDPPSPEWRVD
ncbi:hypothetical protein [Glycomyces sp. NPDC047010]|uniref:hypothetical protein n=1 Tax=Glycomyces sp. NPDC047010 TaxID=3155023 RepID=UPI0033E2A0EB